MKEKKKKDPKKKKRALIITGSILGVFALFVITVVMITIIGDKANIKRAESYDPVVIENQLVPEKTRTATGRSRPTAISRSCS